MKKILFLDLETSDTIDKKGKRNPSPFLGENFLVSYGYKTQGFSVDEEGYEFLAHAELSAAYGSAEKLQKLLDEAELLVCHNVKFDLQWLLECGFKYDKALYDTMVCEYVLACGCHADISLDGSCTRRKTVGKLGTLVETYWEKGLGFDKIPMGIVEQYGRRDVQCCFELYEAQLALLKTAEFSSLQATIDMSNEFIWCLVDMERNGIHIDAQELDRVKQDFTKEYKELREKLETIAKEVMGDTKINLDSPEQLSWLIYSRKVKDKHVWKKIFNIGTDARGKRLRPPRMSASKFVDQVKDNTEILKRTRAEHCLACQGRGRILDKLTKSGASYKHPPRCSQCNGVGYTLVNLPSTAGFKLSPRGPIDTASGGFGSDKETINGLLQRIKNSGRVFRASSNATEFLEAYIRYSAIGTYLDTFVAGIERGIDRNFILHTKLMQCITKTGRLSSTEPNLQNMPRASTFPVRKAISSRWEGGEILEFDFSQLEFRTYVYLAQDKQGMKDIADKVDVHAYTASIIECSRQDAKPHTFKPLYFGHSGTEAEQRYYKAFQAKYPEITQYQLDNIQIVLKEGSLSIPSGRIYKFQGTHRTPSGYVTNSTQISNYPCQGLATGDIVPVFIIMIRKKLKDLKSLLILTVHDSIEIDVYPGERGLVVEVIKEALDKLPEELYNRYGFKLNVPINEGEIKIGSNWLEMKNV